MTDQIEPRCQKALRKLIESEDSPFPGAIGRAGTLLVRYGFARRLGPVTYAGTYARGERPSRWVAFELTPKGKAACKRFGLISIREHRRQKGLSPLQRA